MGSTLPKPSMLTSVALSVRHESVAVPPLSMLFGVAVIEAVGAGGGGGGVTGLTGFGLQPASSKSTNEVANKREVLRRPFTSFPPCGSQARVNLVLLKTPCRLLIVPA